VGEIPEALTEMSEDQRQEAMRRFKIIRGHFEDGVSQAELARCSGVPLKTLQRWVRRYREHGLAGLGRLVRKDAGQRRGLPREELLLIEGLALQPPRRSMATIHRLVCEVASQKGWPCPSYRRVCQIVRGISPSMMTLSQEGKSAQRDQFDLILRREASRPNEIWQADHYHLKIWVLDEEGQPVRPWLTVIQDDYSRAVAGYRLTLCAPTALHSALTLRQAILRKGQAHWQIHGIPKVFYTDHGRDFTSDHLEQVAADLPMQVIFSRLWILNLQESGGDFAREQYRVCSRATRTLQESGQFCKRATRNRGRMWAALNGVTNPSIVRRETRAEYFL